MPAVEAIRSFPRARALALVLLFGAAGCTDPVGPSEQLLEVPQLGIAPTPIATMSSASEHACALRATGVVECWGDNAYGEAPAVREAAGALWYTHLDVSDEHSCAVRSDGAVECWGRNDDGEAPALRSASNGQFVRVAAGGDHTCAVRTDGVIECWGDNQDGQAPTTRTAVGSTYVRVTAGLFHTCGLRADGAIECWGFDFGQAPSTWTSSNSSPFVSISSNTGFTCALRSDGVVECVGQNDNGEAPDSMRASGSHFTQVSAGLAHACGLRADGAIQCWGQNDDAEAPASWTAPSGSFAHVAAGNFFTCAMRDTGFVACIGPTSPPVPGRPTTFNATVVSGRIQLSWSDSSAETSFEIQRRNTLRDGSWSGWREFQTVGRDVTLRVDSSVVEGPRYQYRIRACAVGGCSDRTNSQERYTFTTAPAPVPALVPTAVRGGVVDLAWRDSTGYEASFEIGRRAADDPNAVWVALSSVSGTSTTFRDSTALRGIRYRYRIRPCNPVGCAPYTASTLVIAETVGTTPPSASATLLSPSQIQVTWGTSSNVVWYDVQRRVQTGGVWGAYLPRDTVQAPTHSWIDGALAPNTNYQYRVRACTSIGCSAFRLTDRVRTPAS